MLSCGCRHPADEYLRERKPQDVKETVKVSDAVKLLIDSLSQATVAYDTCYFEKRIGLNRGCASGRIQELGSNQL